MSNVHPLAAAALALAPQQYRVDAHPFTGTDQTACDHCQMGAGALAHLALLFPVTVALLALAVEGPARRQASADGGMLSASTDRALNVIALAAGQ